MNIGFISLGCSKNLVDTEMMIGIFKNKEYTIVSDPAKADIILINTCGFIDKSKEEAIDTILEMAKYKENGKCKLLIATGCLVERYKDELVKLLPEVDIFMKYKDYAEENKDSNLAFDKMFAEIDTLLNKKNSNRKEEKEKNIKEKKKDNNRLEFLNRVYTTGNTYEYIRISEGCDNRCTYCAIPYIRGKFVSRKIEDIVEEAKKIGKSGRTEIILIGQDTSKYGIDIYGKPVLDKLLKELVKINTIKRIRFLYTYPEDISDSLIDVVKNEKKICKYFDIPIQHISDSVLKRMNRKTNSENIKNVINKLRKNIPGVVIRSTVMVGFPGETEEDFNLLYDFIKDYKFDKLGAFSYSKEEGTPAARIKEQINGNTKKARYNKIMKLQNDISKEKEKALIGKEFEILVEGFSEDGIYLVGRTYMDSPDIDGLAYIINEDPDVDESIIGKYVKAKVVDTDDYDIICRR